MLGSTLLSHVVWYNDYPLSTDGHTDRLWLVYWIPGEETYFDISEIISCKQIYSKWLHKIRQYNGLNNLKHNVYYTYHMWEGGGREG